MTPAMRFAELCADSYATDAPFTPYEIDGLVIIAWRGTKLSNIQDVLADIDCLPHWSMALGERPRGFVLNVAAAMPAVVKAIGSKPHYHIGHSLGGASAQECAASMIVAGNPPRGTTTFCAPRIGALGGVLITHPGDDFRCGNDMIPDLPLLFPQPRPASVVRIGKPTLNPIDCHYIANVRVALAEALAA